jgi:ST7 protein
LLERRVFQAGAENEGFGQPAPIGRKASQRTPAAENAVEILGDPYQRFRVENRDHGADEHPEVVQRHEAMETEGPQQSKLAKKALKFDPDCADALVLLANNAHTLPEAAELYERGLRAAERSLGKDRFEEFAGHFWGFLETRPYMQR